MTVTPARASTPPKARASAAARLAALRGGLGVLQRVSPALASRAGVRLWLRLPDNAGRRKDFRPHPGVVGSVKTVRGTRIAVETWGDEGAPVVHLVHGWGGWRGQLGGLVAPLLAGGFRVVAFDAPSHGESGPSVFGPRHGTVLEAIEAFTAVAERFGTARGVVAHSMGCTVASMTLRERAVDADRLVLVAPNHDFTTMTRQVAGTLGLREGVRRAMQDRIEVFAGRPMTDFDLIPLGVDGSLPPTLVVHDRLDKEVPYEVGAMLAETWPEAELLSTEGLGHQRILTDPVVLAAVAEHVTA